MRLACAACGWTAGSLETEPYPFRCPNAGKDDADHVVRSHHATSDIGHRLSDDASDSDNPFIRYRTSLYSWHVALAHGLSDGDYVALVERVDGAISEIAAGGFRATPLVRNDSVSGALAFEQPGGVFVKDETRNVSGSHKARHLMGVALYFEVLRALGIDRDATRPLAIASCGNAALAAAVVARAIDRQLLVFVPEHASPDIVRRLLALGASVTRCSRMSRPGDPCYMAFRRALNEGALPFSCQGNENGLVIEGGATLGCEIVDAMTPDRVFIQVGGGALASACIQAFSDAVHAGRLPRMPRIHAVQTCGGYPLKRASDRVVERLHATDGTDLDSTFAYARAHRSEFMWPWETEPRSIAAGILDDETYDWAAVVEGMLRSGGSPIVVDEPLLEEANALARKTTGIDVDYTGSAGLAGLLALSRSADRPRPDERICVLFTGVRR